MDVTIRTDDYHTGGEPFRIVVDGVAPLQGRTLLDRRGWAIDNLDHVRRLVVNEPRGHADMYGCFVTHGDDGADLGAVFFHKDGFSTACGHGTIALATWVMDGARIDGIADRRAGDDVAMTIDVPSGRLEVVAVMDGPSVDRVRFRNVASYPTARALSMDTAFGRLRIDIAYGGAFYASVALDDTALDVTPASLPSLIDLAREIKAGLVDHPGATHPDDPRLSGLYGVIFHETPTDDPHHQRNVTVFADGEVDRSPCGSGTSARLALLHDSGAISVGQPLRHESIVGSTFIGRVEATSTERPGAVITSVEGSAYRCGRSEFWLDPRDPMGLGFQLR